MQKTIYYGKTEGFCSRYEFPKVFEKFGIECVVNDLPVNKIGSYPNYNIYHLGDVTVRLENILCGGLDIKNVSYHIKVDLFGKEEKVSEVEKIILENVKTFKSGG